MLNIATPFTNVPCAPPPVESPESSKSYSAQLDSSEMPASSPRRYTTAPGCVTAAPPHPIHKIRCITNLLNISVHRRRRSAPCCLRSGRSIGLADRLRVLREVLRRPGKDGRNYAPVDPNPPALRGVSSNSSTSSNSASIFCTIRSCAIRSPRKMVWVSAERFVRTTLISPR